MGALDYQTWQHRITFVMERYHQKDKSLDSDHLFEKAFTTLESLCVGEEAEDSLYVSRSRFFMSFQCSAKCSPLHQNYWDKSEMRPVAIESSSDGILVNLRRLRH
jgi:hypothetical protein